MGHGQTEGPGINSAYVLGVRVCASRGGEAQLPLFALRSGPSLPDAPSHHMEFKARMNGRLLSDEWSSRPGAPERRLSGPAAFLAHLLLAASPCPPSPQRARCAAWKSQSAFCKKRGPRERAGGQLVRPFLWVSGDGQNVAGARRPDRRMSWHKVGQGGTRWDAWAGKRTDERWELLGDTLCTFHFAHGVSHMYIGCSSA